MIEKILIVMATATVSIIVTFFSTLLMEKRRNSLKHAREFNPEYFRQLHCNAVLLREALEGFGTVWDKKRDRYSALNQDLYKILISRIEDYNRELSITTNSNVFLLPSQLQVICEDIRNIANNAVQKTDIVKKMELTAKTITGNRVSINNFPTAFESLDNIRCIESRVKSSLSGSPFCNRSFRTGLIHNLIDLERKVKTLAVD